MAHRGHLTGPANEGDIQELRRRLDAGKHPDSEVLRGGTALMYSRNRDIAELLLDRKADPNFQNSLGTTPLMHCKDCLAPLLLARKADPNLPDRWGLTALMFASENGHRDRAALLLDHKADVNHQNALSPSLDPSKCQIRITIGSTPLMRASSRGRRDCVALLLGRKADPKIKNDKGYTALDLTQRSKHEIIALLSDRKRIALLRLACLQKASAPQTVRQWCRIFAVPDRVLNKSTGEQKMLLEFFIQYPGLRRLVGGAIVRFYDPCTADYLKKPSDCVVM